MSTAAAMTLVDRVLAHAVESVWEGQPMRRDLVAVWHRDEERVLERAAGEDDPRFDLLRAVLSASRDSVSFSAPMDGTAVDVWRAEADDLR